MRRVLGLADLLVIAAASIGPAFSLATTFGAMVALAGSGAPLALALVSAIMAFVAVGYWRLGERYPNAGSSYTWVRHAFGPRAGAYAAWVLIVANVFAVVATAVPAGTYTLSLLAPNLANVPLAGALVGAGWVLATGALLYGGLRPTARVTNVLLIIELLVLVAATIAAFVHPLAGHTAAHTPAPNATGLLGAIVIGIWMIDGWEVSASTAEEAGGTPTAPGLGGLGGLAISALVMGASMIAFLRIGTIDGFAAHEGDAIAYVAAQLGGVSWRIVVTITVLVSLAAALQATLIYLSRSFYAMGRDGVLPAELGALDARGQPVRAVVLLTLGGAAFTLASGLSPTIQVAFAFILSGTAFFLGLLFLMSAAAAVKVFWGERSHRFSGVVSPGVGAIALVGVLGFSLLQSDPNTRWFICAAALLGIPLALWRGRTQT